jgi:hypothetical protein
VTDPLKGREAAAETHQAAPQWHGLYLLKRDEADAGRPGYGALQVAVQRVAAREAALKRSERRR